MIQRIQTVYLFFSVIVTTLLFFMPVARLTVPDEFTYLFYTTKVTQAGEAETLIACNRMSTLLHILLAALGVLLIFLYKKRFLQLRLCAVHIVLSLGMFGLMWWQVGNMTAELHAVRQWGFAFCLLLVGSVLDWLALRGIVRDIALLKSYDRIR